MLVEERMRDWFCRFSLSHRSNPFIMVVGPQVHFKEGHAGGGGAGVRVRYTEEQLGFGAGILSFHAGGLVLPFRWFQCGSQQSLFDVVFSF